MNQNLSPILSQKEMILVIKNFAWESFFNEHTY